MKSIKVHWLLWKEKKSYNLYKLIDNTIWGGVATILKSKVNVGEKLNLKSSISDDNVKQKK